MNPSQSGAGIYGLLTTRSVPCLMNGLRPSPDVGYSVPLSRLFGPCSSPSVRSVPRTNETPEDSEVEPTGMFWWLSIYLNTSTPRLCLPLICCRMPLTDRHRCGSVPMEGLALLRGLLKILDKAEGKCFFDMQTCTPPVV